MKFPSKSRPEVKSWLEEALNDLRAAKSLLDSGIYNWACFIFQQASEKAVKSLLYRLGKPSIGHSVMDPLDLVSKFNIEFPSELMDYARELDTHHLPARNMHPVAQPISTMISEQQKALCMRLNLYWISCPKS